MNGMPMIRIELEQMRQTVLHQFNNHNEEISNAVDKELKKVIENFDFESAVSKVANEVITQAIEEYFKSYSGMGRQIITELVFKNLDNVFNPKTVKSNEQK